MKQKQQGQCLIYVLYNKEGKIDWVGSTRNIQRRLWEHRQELGVRPSWAVIDCCPREKRQETERRWQSHYLALGYPLRNLVHGQGQRYLTSEENLKHHGGHKLRGVPKSEETKAKMSAAQKGKPKHWSPEGRKRLKVVQFKPGHSMWNALSDEEKEKQRQMASDAWNDPDRKKRMSVGLIPDNWNNMTSKQKKLRGKRISDALRGKKLSDACKKKLSRASNARAKEIGNNIRKFWKELRKDPVRYAEYIKKRTEAIIKAKQINKQSQRP